MRIACQGPIFEKNVGTIIVKSFSTAELLTPPNSQLSAGIDHIVWGLCGYRVNELPINMALDSNIDIDVLHCNKEMK